MTPINKILTATSPVIFKVISHKVGLIRDSLGFYLMYSRAKFSILFKIRHYFTKSVKNFFQVLLPFLIFSFLCKSSSKKTCNSFVIFLSPQFNFSLPLYLNVSLINYISFSSLKESLPIIYKCIIILPSRLSLFPCPFPF